jgi:type II secretory pathway component PulJ
MRHRTRLPGGFTLFEVLGVVFVTALVLGFATDYYIDLSRASNRASENTRDIRHATAILDRMARDFESTLLLLKPDGSDPNDHPWLFFAESRHSESGADRVKFITTNFQPRRSEEHESNLSMVAYTLSQDEEEGGYRLFRWSTPQLPESLDRSFPLEDDEGNVLFAEGLADFGLRFYGEDGDEGDSWDSTTIAESGSLPASVEITVAMLDPDDPDADPEAAVPYSRRVRLPVRPLNIALLIDPDLATAEDGAEDGEEDGEDDEDGQTAENSAKLTLADCLNVAAMTDDLSDAAPGFKEFVDASLDRPWSEVSSMLPPEANSYILPKPECQ